MPRNRTYAEVSGDRIEVLPREGHTFDAGVLLLAKRENGLIEDDTLVLFCEHLHNALHEVLRGRVSCEYE